MASRKVNTEGIDESLLLASIGKSRTMGIQTPAEPLPDTQGQPKMQTPEKKGTSVPEEDSVTSKDCRNPPKRNRHGGYDATYLVRNEIKTRQCVYISREVHGKISKIVNVIADSEITVGGYIDTVLMRHLEEHRDEINGLYRRERDNLI